MMSSTLFQPVNFNQFLGNDCIAIQSNYSRLHVKTANPLLSQNYKPITQSVGHSTYGNFVLPSHGIPQGLRISGKHTANRLAWLQQVIVCRQCRGRKSEPQCYIALSCCMQTVRPKKQRNRIFFHFLNCLVKYDRTLKKIKTRSFRFNIHEPRA